MTTTQKANSMTKLEFINKFFFQWFFIRLARCEEKVIDKINVHEYSITPDGWGVGGTVKHFTIWQWYSIMYWVFPNTGWDNDYKFINGKQRVFALKWTKRPLV